MKKMDVPFTLSSLILSGNLLTSSPVVAQTHFNVNVSQLSFQNQLTLVSSNSEPKVEENPVKETLQAQSEQLYSNAPPDLDEVVNVNQLQDVTPDDWAYEALRNLVQKYQCISGSGEGNFNGKRAMTRYEFAAALNNCLLKLRRSIYSLSNKFATQEDLVVFQRLKEEFTQELQNITGRIENLEQKTALVQSRKFSTTTVLKGTVNFDLTSAFGDKKSVSPGSNLTEKINPNYTISAAGVLSLDTSFTGKDRLRTQVRAGNINDFGSSVTGTDMTSLTGAINTGNQLKLATIFYQFPIGDRGTVVIAPVANFPTRIFPALNPVNSISNFGSESPIYAFAFGSGAVVYYQFTDKIAAGISYLSSSGNTPNEGLFGGQYTALTQVTYCLS